MPFFPNNVAQLGNRKFYVSTSGNDNNSGLTPDDPWQTLAKVNAGTFYPGDTIHFRRGDIWNGDGLDVGWNGIRGNPITLKDYSVGNIPIIDAGGMDDCIDINGYRWLNFENLELVSGTSSGLHFYNSAAWCNVTNVIIHGCGNDGVVFIDGAHDCYVLNGRSYGNYQSGPIRCTGYEISDTCFNITLDGVESDNNQGNAAGIAVYSHDTPTALEPVNILIKNANIHDNAFCSLLFAREDTNTDRTGVNVYLQNNTIDGNIVDDGLLTVVNL